MDWMQPRAAPRLGLNRRAQSCAQARDEVRPQLVHLGQQLGRFLLLGVATPVLHVYRRTNIV